MSTAPESGVRRPVAMAIVVDFPAPFGPSSPKTSPAGTSSHNPSTAAIGPNCLRMARRESTGDVESWASRVAASRANYVAAAARSSEAISLS
jgi:hypothetical protein